MAKLAHETETQLIGILLAGRLREDFSPGETLAVLAATLDEIIGWLDHDDRLLAVATFRAFIDEIEQGQDAVRRREDYKPIPPDKFRKVGRS
jgi:hypothetical protein